MRLVRGASLAVRVVVALGVLLVVTITATCATLLYNSAVALRNEAEADAVHLAGLLSAQFAEMGEISLANVARTLDATLDDQMTAQARIAANLVAAAEAAGQGPDRVIETLDAVAATTVLDEFWITNEEGFTYLTNVRDADGQPVPFQFHPNPALQPQASKFYSLLSSPLDGDEVITQPAPVREIDQEVYKYVGVGGVDQPRIVQVGNALAFGEQEILSNTYTGLRADVSAVIEGILGQHMVVQATLLEYMVGASQAAGWLTDFINGRLRRIVDTTIIGEIRVSDRAGRELYNSLRPALAGTVASGRPHALELGPILSGTTNVIDHPTAARPRDNAAYKYVTLASPTEDRIVQVGIPIEGSSGNLLYSVYQSQLDTLIRERLEALWFVNLDRRLVASAPRAGQLSEGMIEAASIFGDRAEGMLTRAMDEGQVISTASLSLLSPADRGIWVAAPVTNAGGIRIGGLALAINLDDIAATVQSEALNTTVIAFLLFGFTGAAALWGTRWLTRPIEVIASAAREVESGSPPDADQMQAVIERSDELGSLARVFSDMTVQVFSREEQLETLVAERTLELQESNKGLRLAQEALQQDLEMAKSVQAALVREGNMHVRQYSGYARMTPAQQLGGDFVEMTELPDGRLFLTVGDVSGKGVAAALFMAASQGAINSASVLGGRVTAIADEVNDRLCGENPMELFVTCMLGVVDPDQGVIEYVSAGHEPAILVGADDTPRVLPLTGGIAMGVLDNFSYGSRREAISPGETLFIYTDGLTDALNRKGQMFGKKRLFKSLAGAAERSTERIVDQVWLEIADFSEGAPAADDMTCLALRREAS